MDVHCAVVMFVHAKHVVARRPQLMLSDRERRISICVPQPTREELNSLVQFTNPQRLALPVPDFETVCRLEIDSHNPESHVGNEISRHMAGIHIVNEPRRYKSSQA